MRDDHEFVCSETIGTFAVTGTIVTALTSG
jgi:hypothetical protein